MSEKNYELTVLLPNGDWSYRRGFFPDFHAACEAGLNDAKATPGARLIRIVEIPDVR